MPYYRDDDQYQMVANVTWLKGGHNIRFGSDLYFTAMNHIQPEILDDSFGARGGFAFDDGPTLRRGGPGGSNFNSFASFLLGLPNEAGRLKLNVAPYTTRSWQYSTYIRDQWQVSPRVTLSFGTRYEYFPIPTRTDRGLERYNLDTNMMEIGGLGGVPKDLGVSMQKNLFAPRLGATFRLTDSTVVRGGVGLTNDPYSLARSMRTNHPILLNLYDEAPHAWAYVRPIRGRNPADSGRRSVGRNHSRTGERHRGDAADRFQARPRVVVEHGGGERAAVAAGRRDRLHRHAPDRSAGAARTELGADGGGSDGRQLVQKFGRTAATILIAPIGDTSYNAMQTRQPRHTRVAATIPTAAARREQRTQTRSPRAARRRPSL